MASSCASVKGSEWLSLLTETDPQLPQAFSPSGGTDPPSIRGGARTLHVHR